MSQKISEEKELIVKNIEEFAKKKIEPIALNVDKEDHIPESLYAEMKDHGLLTLIVPEKYGGLSLDTCTYAKIIEIIARFSGGIALSIEAHNSLGLNHVFLFGNENQKEEVISDVIKNSKPVAWALTEQTSGSDAKNMHTTYERENGYYILNGSKTFITHGVSSNYIVIFAKGKEGINAFLLNSKDEGIERNKLNDKMGVRGSDTGEIILHDVRIPEERIIGKTGEGFKQALKILEGGRIAIGSLALGLANACLEKSIEYAKQRTAFGSKLSEFQGIQFYLADIATDIRAATLLIEHACDLFDRGIYARKEISMAKYFASQVAMEASRMAIQIYGGYGYFRDTGIERYLRDSKLMEIGEGTNEVQKIIIARELLK
ncbi:MAG: acyl-CoA dehydrogenase family protein [Thermoplasmata archaeon]